jgi:hypothetical protein
MTVLMVTQLRSHLPIYGKRRFVVVFTICSFYLQFGRTRIKIKNFVLLQEFEFFQSGISEDADVVRQDAVLMG